MTWVQKIVRSCSGILAAALLVAGAHAAPSRNLPQLLTEPVSGPAPPEALPPVRSPRPYREVAHKACDESERTLKFDKIGDFRLLEISNLTCITIQSPDDTGKFFVVSKGANLNKLRSIIAVLPVTGISGSTITASHSGPFYFDAGEAPFISTSTPAGGYAMICTISGTLWRTD
jgi:hypothetical protein